MAVSAGQQYQGESDGKESINAVSKAKPAVIKIKDSMLWCAGFGLIHDTWTVSEEMN